MEEGEFRINFPFIFIKILFRWHSTVKDSDSGIYFGNAGDQDFSSNFHQHRHARLIDTVLIDKVINRLNDLDFKISISLGQIQSEKLKHEFSRNFLNMSEVDPESSKLGIEKKDNGIKAENIFKKINELEKKLTEALR